MAEINLPTSTHKLNFASNKNPFRWMSDAQLMHLARAINSEMTRRCRNSQMDKSFKEERDLLKKRIPEIHVADASPNDRRIPKAIRQENLLSPPTARMKYLKALLAQDWSNLWTECDKTRKYCVYAHVDPSGAKVTFSPQLGGLCPLPFYIGKGTLSRAHDLNRNQGHGIKINQLLSAGYTKTEIVRVLSKNLSESEAFELEAKLIYFFGTIYEPNRKGVLLNLDLSLRPSFDYVMAKLP